jgi:hypothetical protein
MFRNLAMVMVSVCAVSLGSPAWSQNSPDDATPPPPDYQVAPGDFVQHQKTCLEMQRKADDKRFCTGDIAQHLFKKLGKDSPSSTTEDRGWLIRKSAEAYVRCWAKPDRDGDPIVSMSYFCHINAK